MQQQSPPCQACLIKINDPNPRLCDKCESYANQDYVPGKEDLILGADIECLDLSIWSKQSVEGGEKKNKVNFPSFKNMLKGAHLSRREWFILRATFLDGLAFEAIAARLRMSRQGVHQQYEAALRKIKSHLVENGLVAPQIYEATLALDNSRCEEPESPCYPVKHFKPDPKGVLVLLQECYQAPLKIAPQNKISNRVFSHCPRCNVQAFCVDQDFQYCMDCLWNTDQDSFQLFKAKNPGDSNSTKTILNKEKGMAIEECSVCGGPAYVQNQDEDCDNDDFEDYNDRLFICYPCRVRIRQEHEEVTKWSVAPKAVDKFDSDNAVKSIATSVSKLAFTKTDHAIVRNTLLTLPELQRNIIILKFWRNMDNDEIAQELKVRTKTVEGELQAGYEALKERVLREPAFSRTKEQIADIEKEKIKVSTKTKSRDAA
jgi:DNA-directed RNA polymerase specialized sigma24 family protein